MTSLRHSLFALLLIVLPLAAQAEKQTVKSGPFQTAVLELYTSEGCSSCPPADLWLSKLTEVPQQDLNVLALAFHVDYWDYIGWKDEFASPRYTDRQRELARLNKQSSIYTPEFFVDGLEARGTLSILEKIRKANKTPSQVDLELSFQQQNEHYVLDLIAQAKTDQALKVQFVLFENDLSNKVKKGENAGKQLDHQRVVRYLSPLVTLKPKQQQLIKLKPDWKTANLGIGVLIKSGSEEYVQSLFSPVSP